MASTGKPTTVRVEVLAEGHRAIEQIVADRLAQITVAMHRDCQRAVRLTNDDGWRRSQPGESPHTSQRGPHRGIVREINKERLYFAVGVTKAAFHLFFQEVGTAAHRIIALRSLFLRIPWRAEGRGRRRPTNEEIKRIPLREETRDGKTEWVYYRKEVNHPGQAPRPWVVSTIRANLEKYRAMLRAPDESGQPVDATLTINE